MAVTDREQLIEALLRDRRLAELATELGSLQRQQRKANVSAGMENFVYALTGAARRVTPKKVGAKSRYEMQPFTQKEQIQLQELMGDLKDLRKLKDEARQDTGNLKAKARIEFVEKVMDRAEKLYAKYLPEQVKAGTARATLITGRLDEAKDTLNTILEFTEEARPESADSAKTRIGVHIKGRITSDKGDEEIVNSIIARLIPTRAADMSDADQEDLKKFINDELVSVLGAKDRSKRVTDDVMQGLQSYRGGKYLDATLLDSEAITQDLREQLDNDMFQVVLPDGRKVPLGAQTATNEAGEYVTVDRVTAARGNMALMVKPDYVAQVKDIFSSPDIIKQLTGRAEGAVATALKNIYAAGPEALKKFIRLQFEELLPEGDTLNERIDAFLGLKEDPNRMTLEQIEEKRAATMDAMPDRTGPLSLDEVKAKYSDRFRERLGELNLGIHEIARPEVLMQQTIKGQEKRGRDKAVDLPLARRRVFARGVESPFQGKEETEEEREREANLAKRRP